MPAEERAVAAVGFGHSEWSLRGCRSLIETPPGPYTPAESCPRHKARSCPTGLAPGRQTVEC